MCMGMANGGKCPPEWVKTEERQGAEKEENTEETKCQTKE